MNKPSFCLVYQAGIANVFQVKKCSHLTKERGTTILIYQGGFTEASFMALGMLHALARVSTYSCNKVGNIESMDWSTDLYNQPFSDHIRIVQSNQ